MIPSNDQDINPEVETYFIPVVVHVIHDDGSEKLTSSEIEAGINMLNTYMGGETGSSQDTKIEFFLAKIDYSGGCNDGIVEVPNSIVNNPIPIGTILGPQEYIKSLSMWDYQNYLNIWTVREIEGQTIGYSTIPFILEPARDGIVVNYTEFSTKTLVHEVGHYLGLLHVWGCNNLDPNPNGPPIDACVFCGESDAESDELFDYVTDTNPALGQYTGQEGMGSEDPPSIDCDNDLMLTCSNEVCILIGDEGQETEVIYETRPYPHRNYMSYSESCPNTFTAKQGERFYHFLNTVRRDLWYPGYIIKKEMIVDKETKFHRDVNIYAGGRLVLEAEAIMAEGTKIIVHEGGQLVVNGGKIRACGLNEPGGDKRSTWDGIHVEGTNADGFNVEMLLATIEDVDGYAIHVENSDVQMQNGNINIVRSTFNNVKGLAEFKKSIGADNSNSIIDECIQNGGVMGVNSLNCNGIQITNSKFFDIENICVATTGGSYLIEANEFHSDNIDIALTHLFPGEPSTITNGNEFRGDLYGIRASGATIDNHLIEGNIFYGQEFDPDVPISYYDRDIYMDGITDYSIVDNEFYGLVGVSSRATLNTNDISQFENNVTSNEFKRNLTGIYPHASNPNYYFSDNCFYTRYIDAQIEGAMANQGEEGGVPPNNCFTHQGSLGSGYNVVDLGGNPDEFDYVDPIISSIDCRTPLLAHPNVNVLETNDNPSINCGGPPRERTRAINFSTDVIYEQYLNIGDYIYSDNLSAAILEQSNMLINSEESVNMSFLADAIITLHENNFQGDNSRLIQTLEAMAHKKLPSSGYAQALYFQLTHSFVDNLDLSFLNEVEISERNQKRIESKENSEKSMSIFPVPARNQLFISSAFEIKHVKVIDMTGAIVYESNSAKIIDTSKWSNGVYIMQFFDSSGDRYVLKSVINK